MPTIVAATEFGRHAGRPGLDADATDVGREAVELALRRADLEMIFVDMNINGPGIRQVLYELRISPTTAEIPIAMLAADRPARRGRAAGRRARTRDRRAADPFGRSAWRDASNSSTALSGRFAVPAERRAAEAVEAMTWLASSRPANDRSTKSAAPSRSSKPRLYRPDCGRARHRRAGAAWHRPKANARW